ncbi:ELMO/CED-12 family-domain-containing protein, partial [Thamnocephalis sphaerospora]
MLATQVELVYESREVQCLVDLSLPVDEIVRAICLEQLGLREEPGRYALRLASTLELITDDNIRRKVTYGERIRLVVSPQAEARDMAKSLQSNTVGDLKKQIFTLKEAIKEPEFAEAFCQMGGLHVIMDTVRAASGNSLAYALSSLANLMEHDFGWDLITDDFIHFLAMLIVHQTLVNVCRPATAVLIKLVCADASSSGHIQCYGYAKLHQAMSAEPAFLPALVGRLGSTDYVLAQLSLALINSVSMHVTPEYAGWYQMELDRLGVRKAVMRLMQLNPGEEMGKHLLDFQQIILRLQHRLKHTQVGPTTPGAKELLDGVWRAARVTDSDRQVAEETSSWTGDVQWRLIGFETENPWKEMQRVGLLGLIHMRHYVQSDVDHFAKLIIEQLNRSAARRCPYARASMEITELLSDQWNIGSGYAPATTFQPLQLVLEDVHTTTLLAFFRAWNHMEAAVEDFDKVSALLRSHVRYTLHEEGCTSLFEFERAMLETPYEVMRSRQLKDLEQEDDLLTKLAVRNLRERLYRESYEFVKQQRIDCLVRGAWFPAPATVHAAATAVAGGNIDPGVQGSHKARRMAYRFYRLSPNKKYLHYGEFTEMTAEPPNLDDLPERGEQTVSTQQPQGVAPKPGGGRGPPAFNFSLMTGNDLSLVDFAAPDATRFAEWTDGFNMLLDRNIANRDTADLIMSLTEVVTRVHLLDVAAEKLEIPGWCDLPTQP